MKVTYKSKFNYFELNKYQQLMWKTAQVNSPNLAISGGRRIGKTTFLKYFALDFCKNNPGSVVTCISPTNTTNGEVVHGFQNLLNTAFKTLTLTHDTFSRKVFSNGSAIYPMSANSILDIKDIPLSDLVIVDEAAFTRKFEFIEKNIFMIAKKAVFVSTPREHSHFNYLCKRSGNPYPHLRIPNTELDST